MKTLRPATVFIGLILGVLVLLLATLKLPVSGRDFYIYWSGARALQTGRSPYDLTFLQASQQVAGWDVSREPIPFQPFLYPPWLAILVWPLGWLPFHTALTIWLTVGGWAVVTAGALELRAVKPDAKGPALLFALLLGLTYVPVLHLLAVAQVAALLSLTMALAVWGVAQQRVRLAAVCLGLLSIKPHIGLIVAAFVGIGRLVERDKRALMWLAGTWLACGLVAFIVAPNWIDEMLSAPQRFEAFTGKLALANPADDPTVLAALRVGTQTNGWLVGLVALGLLLVAGLAVRRARLRAMPSLLWLSAFGCVAVFIITPYARAYDLALLIWPLIYLAFAPRLAWPKWARYGTVAFVYACPIILIMLRADGVWNILAVLVLAAALLAG